MTRGPGRHSERNFRAAEQHYNAAEWPTDAERGNVTLCRHQILNWFYGPNRSEDLKPTGSLGPASQKQLVRTSTKLANRRTSLTIIIIIIILNIVVFYDDWLKFCFLDIARGPRLIRTRFYLTELLNTKLSSLILRMKNVSASVSLSTILYDICGKTPAMSRGR